MDTPPGPSIRHSKWMNAFNFRLDTPDYSDSTSSGSPSKYSSFNGLHPVELDEAYRYDDDEVQKHPTKLNLSHLDQDTSGTSTPSPTASAFPAKNHILTLSPITHAAILSFRRFLTSPECMSAQPPLFRNHHDNWTLVWYSQSSTKLIYLVRSNYHTDDPEAVRRYEWTASIFSTRIKGCNVDYEKAEYDVEGKLLAEVNGVFARHPFVLQPDWEELIATILKAVRGVEKLAAAKWETAERLAHEKALKEKEESEKSVSDGRSRMHKRNNAISGRGGFFGNKASAPHQFTHGEHEERIKLITSQISSDDLQPHDRAPEERLMTSSAEVHSTDLDAEMLDPLKEPSPTIEPEFRPTRADFVRSSLEQVAEEEDEEEEGMFVPQDVEAERARASQYQLLHAPAIKTEPGLAQTEAGLVEFEPVPIKTEPGRAEVNLGHVFSLPVRIKTEPGHDNLEPVKIKSEPGLDPEMSRVPMANHPADNDRVCIGDWLRNSKNRMGNLSKF